MFRSLDHPQGAKLFLAKVILKTLTKFLYIDRVLWQHIVLCENTLLGMRLARQTHPQQILRNARRNNKDNYHKCT